MGGLPGRAVGACDFTIRWGLVFLMGFTPLAFGSVQPWAYTTMEAAGFVLLLVWCVKAALEGEVRLPSLPFLVPLLAFLGIVLFQLIPLPPAVLSVLSPATHEFYGWTLAGGPAAFPDSGGAAAGGPGPGWMPLSLYPHATARDLLKLLLYLGVFLIAVTQVSSREDLRFYLGALVLFGFAFSFFAIIQKLTWNEKAFWFIHLRPGRSAFGPYINRNHFAGYVEMIIPLVIGMALSGRAAMRTLRGGGGGSVPSFPGEGPPDQGRLVSFMFLGTVMSAALFLSLSRGGMVSLLAAIVVFGVLLRAKKVPGLKVLLTVGSFIFAVLLFSIWVDYHAVSMRVASLFGAISEVLAGEARPKVWRDGLSMVWRFPVFGVGLGAFPVSYPFFQTVGPGVFFTHAENDYLQLLIETGLAGALAAAAGLTLFAVHVLRRFAALRDPRMIALAAGGVASVAALAVHGTVDFNLHIPANALHVVIVMGLLLVMVHLRGGESEQRLTLPFIHIPLAAPRRRLLWAGASAGVAACLALFMAVTYRGWDERHFERGEKAFAEMLVTQLISPHGAVAPGKRAMEEFRAAIARNPMNASYHFQLGWGLGNLRRVMAEMGVGGEAPLPDYQRHFRNAMRLFPLNPRLHYGVGLFHLVNWWRLSPEERVFGMGAFREALALGPELRDQLKAASTRVFGGNPPDEMVSLLEAKTEEKKDAPRR